MIGYGLSGRVLPGVVTQERAFKAAGRLEQPITYWNAEGLLAAVGFLLCVSLAGDGSRSRFVRAAAAAACAPLGVGTYLSYSRGALAAVVIGLLVLLAAAPRWPMVRAAVVGLVVAALAAVPAALLEGVAVLEGSPGQRRADGLILGAVLLVVVVAAAVDALVSARRQSSGAARTGTLPRARLLPVLAAGAAVLSLVVLVAGSLGEQADPKDASARPTAARFASLGSPRYDYWRVGVNAFAASPVLGLGAGGFRSEWLRERPLPAAALEIHSLPLEALTELGLPGALMLAALVAGVALAGTWALRGRARGAPAACAACAAGGLHAAIDWDWQLPAVTLPVLALAGLLIAAVERERSAVDA